MKSELKEWDRRAKAIMGTAPWPYGVTDRAEQECLIRWAEERGLQYAPGARCLHWIAGKKCPEICRATCPCSAWITSPDGRATVSPQSCSHSRMSSAPRASPNWALLLPTWD
jgi:hypothetical protein